MLIFGGQRLKSQLICNSVFAVTMNSERQLPVWNILVKQGLPLSWIPCLWKGESQLIVHSCNTNAFVKCMHFSHKKRQTPSTKILFRVHCFEFSHKSVFSHVYENRRSNSLECHSFCFDFLHLLDRLPSN